MARHLMILPVALLMAGTAYLLVPGLGPKWEFVLSLRVTRLAGLMVVGIAIAVAPTWPILLGLRVLQGVVLAGLPAVAMAYLSEEVHADGYAQAAGLYIGGTALGGMSGRLITGALADAFGWRWALAGVGLVGLGCALAVIAVLPGLRMGHVAESEGLRR